MNGGWVCPRCDTVNSPLAFRCMNPNCRDGLKITCGGMEAVKYSSAERGEEEIAFMVVEGCDNTALVFVPKHDDMESSYISICEKQENVWVDSDRDCYINLPDGDLKWSPAE